jgi:hypothetical protein
VLYGWLPEGSRVQKWNHLSEPHIRIINRLKYSRNIQTINDLFLSLSLLVPFLDPAWFMQKATLACGRERFLRIYPICISHVVPLIVHHVWRVSTVKESEHSLS